MFVFYRLNPATILGVNVASADIMVDPYRTNMTTDFMLPKQYFHVALVGYEVLGSGVRRPFYV